MDKTLLIDGKDVKFRATALTLRLYRHLIGRDMVQDMNQLRKAYNKAAALGEDATEEERQDAQFSMIDLEIFENVSYVMARHADPEIPGTVEEWLEGFQMFSIWKILPEIIKLWNINEATTSKPKKK